MIIIIDDWHVHLLYVGGASSTASLPSYYSSSSFNDSSIRITEAVDDDDTYYDSFDET